MLFRVQDQTVANSRLDAIDHPPSQQQGFEKALKPPSLYGIVHLMPHIDDMQVSLLFGRSLLAYIVMVPVVKNWFHNMNTVVRDTLRSRLDTFSLTVFSPSQYTL
ncbi:hypothetical protein AVEN_58638-1 [Araneus ventricosus]|uniref:Uncharacterized protein n=1 Tax=Araneus ventricosus TaxID=182803 RepID=A0A4Y2HD51_ARAVE|nr:hypothetical protein AVEN_58638-1 [Araneus ventricosus]